MSKYDEMIKKLLNEKGSSKQTDKRNMPTSGLTAKQAGVPAYMEQVYKRLNNGTGAEAYTPRFPSPIVDQAKRELTQGYVYQRANESPILGGPEKENKYRNLLQQQGKEVRSTLPQAKTYAMALHSELLNGPESADMVRSVVTSPETFMPEMGDLKAWDKQTAARARREQEAVQQYLSEMGAFDTPEYARTEQGMTRPSDDYLEQQRRMLENEYRQSQMADSLARGQQNAYAKARGQSYTWETLFANSSTDDPDELLYDYIAADFLLGNRGEQLPQDPYERTVRLMQEHEAVMQMEPQAQAAELERLRTQFEGLDREALTNPQQPPQYQSQTGEIEGTISAIEYEQTRRARLAELTSEALGMDNYGEASVYDEEYEYTGKPMYNYPFLIGDMQKRSDSLYHFINNPLPYDVVKRISDHFGGEHPYVRMGYNFLTNSERATFNALYMNDPEKAQAYLDALQSELYQRRADVNRAETTTYALAPETRVGAAAATVGENLLNVAMVPAQLIETLQGKDDPNSWTYDLLNRASTTRGVQSKAIGDAVREADIMGLLPEWVRQGAAKMAQSAYTGALGAADNFARAVFGPVGGLALAQAQAMSGSLYESAGRQDMPAVAKLIKAMAVGGLEVGTEKIGLDALFNTDVDTATGYLLKLIGSELGEETLNYAGQEAVRLLAGMLFDYKEEIKAAPEVLDELIDVWMQTAFSAGFGGVPGAVGIQARNTATGSRVKKQGAVGSLIDIGMSMPEKSKSRIEAERLRQIGTDGERVPLARLGRYTRALQADLDAESGRIVAGVMDDAIAERLVEMGEDEQNAMKLAPTIRKMAAGEKIKTGEVQGRWSEAATQVAMEAARQDQGSWAGEMARKVQQQTATLRDAQATLTRAVAKKASQVRTAPTEETPAPQGTTVSTEVQEAGKRAQERAKETASKNATSRVLTLGEGKTGQLVRFEKDADGDLQMVVKTEEGEVTTDMDGVQSAEGSGVAQIAEYVQRGSMQMEAEEANDMLATYEAVGGDAGAYINAYEAAYDAGYYGEAMPAQGLLDEETTKRIFHAGRESALKAEEARLVNARKKRAETTGAVSWLGDVSSNAQVMGETGTDIRGAMRNMAESVRQTVEAIRAISPALGANVVLYNSTQEGREAGVLNGAYIRDTNTLYIDVNSGIVTETGLKEAKEAGTLGYAMVRTMGHELTHMIENASGKSYADYKAAVRSALEQTGKSWSAMVQDKMRINAQAGNRLTRAMAEAEVVADASEMMLQNSKAISELTARNKTLAQRIGEFVKKYLARIRGALERIGAGTQESQALMKMRDGAVRYANGLQNLWDAALMEAVEGRSTTNTETRTDARADANMQNMQENEQTQTQEDIEEEDADTVPGNVGQETETKEEAVAATTEAATEEAENAPVTEEKTAETALEQAQGNTMEKAEQALKAAEKAKDTAVDQLIEAERVLKGIKIKRGAKYMNALQNQERAEQAVFDAEYARQNALDDVMQYRRAQWDAEAERIQQEFDATEIDDGAEFDWEKELATEHPVAAQFSVRQEVDEQTTREYIADSGEEIAETVEERNALQIYQEKLTAYREATKALDEKANELRNMKNMIRNTEGKQIIDLREEVEQLKAERREIDAQLKAGRKKLEGMKESMARKELRERMSEMRTSYNALMDAQRLAEEQIKELQGPEGIKREAEIAALEKEHAKAVIAQRKAYNDMMRIEGTTHVRELYNRTQEFVVESLSGKTTDEIASIVQENENTIHEMEEQMKTLKGAALEQRKREAAAMLARVAKLKSAAAKKYAAKYEKAAKEVKEREVKARKYRKVREKVMKLRKDIGSKIARINTLRVTQTDAKHVPEPMIRIVDKLVKTFTDGALAKLAFTTDEVSELRRVYDLMRQDEDNGTNYYWDEDIDVLFENLEAMKELYNNLKDPENGAVPSIMTLEGATIEAEVLEAVKDIVDHVTKMVESQNETFSKARKETFNDFAQETRNRMAGRANKKVLVGAAGNAQMKLDATFGVGNLKPLQFFKRFDNPRMKEMYDGLTDGMRKYGKIITEAKRREEAIKEKYHYTKWAGEGVLKLQTGGKTITLTRDEALSIYAIAKREAQTLLYESRHLSEGGIELADKASKREGKTIYRQDDDHTYLIESAQLEEINQWLTKEQKAYADEMVGYLSNELSEYGNEASMEMVGFRKFKEGYYFPMRSTGKQKTTSGTMSAEGENSKTTRIKNKGFTKRRIKRANTPLLIDSFSKVWGEHVHEMAYYASMAAPTDNLTRLLNFKGVEGDKSAPTMSALIGMKYGKPTQDYLQNLVYDINGAGMGDNRATGVTDWLIGGFKRGAVAASLSVVVQQPTAVARAMAYISPRHFANNPFSEKEWNELLEHSGTAVVKDMGRFDIGLGKTAAEYLNDDGTGPVSTYKREAAKGKAHAAGKTVNRLMDYLTMLPGLADKWTWTSIWGAVKNEQAKLHPDMDRRSNKFLDMCGRRFDDVINETQVYDSVLSKSDLMRSKNALHKAATTFMAEPITNLNMIYDAMWGNHTPKERAKLIGGVVAAQLLASAFQAAVSAWGDDEDERNAYEKLLGKFVSNATSNLNPAGWIPYISNLVDLLSGYDVARPDTEVIKSIIDYSKAYFKAWEDGGHPTWKQTENFVGTLLNLVGIPARNISRDIRRARNAFMSDWSKPIPDNLGYVALENIEVMGINPYSGANKAYYERMLTAMQKGKAEDVESLRTYLLTSKMVDPDAINNGVKNAYKSEYLQGGIPKEEAVAFLVDNGLADDKRDAFETVDRWDEGGESYSAYRTMRDAISAGDAAQVHEAVTELIDNGFDEDAVHAEARKAVTNSYKAGRITQQQARSLYGIYGAPGKVDDPTDENDWYWYFREVDTGRGKYEDFVDAVTDGASLRSTVQMYLGHGVSKSTLKTQIGNAYKDQLIELYRTDRAAYTELLGRVLNAYVMLGDDRQKRLRTIQSWVEE